MIHLDVCAVGKLDPAFADQSRLLQIDRDPRALERRRALARLALDHVSRALLNRREVDVHRRDPDAEPAGVPGESGDFRAPEHHLGRHAAVVVALASEPVALGERDAEPRAPAELEGDLRARASAADHEDGEPLRHDPPRKPTNARA